MSRKKVGIALGGGAARGIAHIGVLEILEKEDIQIDMVAGTSAGAVIGALLASDIKAAAMREIILGFDWRKRGHLVDFTIPHTGFITGERLKHEIQKVMGGDLQFSDLKMPFACVACDLLTGDEVVMTEGFVADAIRASISIPVIFQAARHNGRYLIDGGLVNQVPVNVVKAMGANYIIAVNVVPRHVHNLKPGPRQQTTAETEKEVTPNIVGVMLSVIDIANSCRIDASLSGANIVIEPNMAHIGPADFNKAEMAILQGEMAAIDAVLKIKKDLAKN
jgi:NTE family protein